MAGRHVSACLGWSFNIQSQVDPQSQTKHRLITTQTFSLPLLHTANHPVCDFHCLSIYEAYTIFLRLTKYGSLQETVKQISERGRSEFRGITVKKIKERWEERQEGASLWRHLFYSFYACAFTLHLQTHKHPHRYSPVEWPLNTGVTKWENKDEQQTRAAAAYRRVGKEEREKKGNGKKNLKKGIE